MRILELAWKAFTIACWLGVALCVLSLESKWQAWGFFTLIFATLVWMVRPVSRKTLDEQIHQNQQRSLRKFHKMQARDRREPAHRAWWRSLGIKP